MMILSTLKLLMAYILKQLSHPGLQLSKVSWRRRPFARTSKPEVPCRSSFLDRIPPNSWDSHMHVVDPVKYSLAKDAQYVPHQHTLSHALNFESTVGLKNIVLVQPSIYGNDNNCILDALRLLTPGRGRAVVAFDPKEIESSTLEEWHSIGVRGVRVNLQSVGRKLDASQLDTLLRQYADVIRPFNWVLQLYVPMATVAVLEKIVPELRVRVCLDHFAQPLLQEGSRHHHGKVDPYLIPGFASLVNLLAQGNTFVKMSAPYRISKEAGYQDLEPIAKELLRVAGRTRVVFATDWPHTRFEGLDIKPFVRKVLEWCGQDEELTEKIFRLNAEDLWGV